MATLDAHQVAVKTRTRDLRNRQTGPSGRKTKRADTLSNQQATPETGNQGGSKVTVRKSLMTTTATFIAAMAIVGAAHAPALAHVADSFVNACKYDNRGISYHG